jgi:hypothetical protein
MAKSEGIVARKKSYATFDFVSMLTLRSHSFLHSNKPTFSDILKGMKLGTSKLKFSRLVL